MRMYTVSEEGAAMLADWLDEEDGGICCGYYCLDCPYMDDDEDVRNITEREEQNDH